MRTNSTVVGHSGIGCGQSLTMQTKQESGALGQLKNFIWQSFQLKGKHSEATSPRDDKTSPNKLSAERILRCQNNYANMPTAMSLRIQEWQKAQNFSEHALEGNSDYVKMESPKRPHVPHPTGLNKNCDYVNFNCQTPSPRRSPDYVNMDGNSDLRTSADYVNLRPEEPNTPHPLTRMNVTLHDQIWSQENSDRMAPRTPQTEKNLLSPPLKHINPNQFWHHPDPLDVSDSLSDKSGSSGDTMIMMTSAEAKRNEANIERSTQKYKHHKDKVSDPRSFGSREELGGDDLDISMNRTEDSDVVLSGATSTDELDSILDEGYGTDSRGSVSNSVSTPLSSSLSSLYSGDADLASRQLPKPTASSMKRHIQLIPKGRIANFKKVQFTANRTKKAPENNNNNSLQQKIMDLAIIDEETENESSATSTASNGSEKSPKRGPSHDVPEKTDPAVTKTHQRYKSERTVRWLDEETAKAPPPPSATVEMRLKSALKHNHQRPKSYSGETDPSRPVKSAVFSLNVSTHLENTSLKSLEDSRKFSSQCNLRSPDNASQLNLPKQGILRNGCSEAKRQLQRHSVAAPLDSLSNSRALWKSDVDISRSSRNLEFCSSSQIYDRMRAMTRPQGGRSGAETPSSASEQCDTGARGRPVFATSADIVKLFQTNSKSDSFVRSQRHSFNTLHQRTELQTREFPQECYNSAKPQERPEPSHLRSASDIPTRCVKDSPKPGILKNAPTVSVSKDKTVYPSKLSVASRPEKLAPPRTKPVPVRSSVSLSLSKLSTLV